MGRPFPMVSCKLSDEQVVGILTTHVKLSQRAAGALYEVSPGTIEAIRAGRRYGWVAPEIERPNRPAPGPRCTECCHNSRGRCTLEFPERLGSLGDRAATLCAAYMTTYATCA
jgi:hypothetical protein